MLINIIVEHVLGLLLKESYMAQNSLEFKLPSRSSPPFYVKQRILSPEEKKGTLTLITPSSQLVQPLADLQNSLPQPFNSEQPWRRIGPLKTVTFHIHAYIYLLFSWISAAAAAPKSLQSCPTPCDPIDGSPPGSALPGILQARTLEWVAISSSNA